MSGWIPDANPVGILRYAVRNGWQRGTFTRRDGEIALAQVEALAEAAQDARDTLRTFRYRDPELDAALAPFVSRPSVSPAAQEDA